MKYQFRQRRSIVLGLSQSQLVNIILETNVRIAKKCLPFLLKGQPNEFVSLTISCATHSHHLEY